MAGFFQDDKGNSSIGRVGFIFALVVFHIAFFYILHLMGGDKIAEHLGGITALYVGGITTIYTYKVQSKKGENNPQKEIKNN